MPEFYKADKYKTLQDQAQAYVHAEKKLGAFTGAPEGDYAVTLPDTVVGEIDTENPLFKSFTTWAKGSQLNQEGYTQLLGMLVQYEASMAPDLKAAQASLGENAAARIQSVAQWSAANLSKEQYEMFRQATAGHDAAAVFQVIEAAIAKTRQVAIPPPGADGVGAGVTAQGLIEAERAKKDLKTGALLYFTDPAHRARVNKMQEDYFKAKEAGNK
jgi:hypothetical protein